MDSFHFKAFSIQQAGSVWKVTLDSVLLGAWALQGDCAEHALDIGTGTGVLALMLAQRFPEIQITGIDIDKASCEEAIVNFACSPWSGRLDVVYGDFNSWAEGQASGFDLIVSNPPYYPLGSFMPAKGRRSIGRNGVGFQLERLAAQIRELLCPGGTFACVLPQRQVASVESAFALEGMALARICRVSSEPELPPVRCLLEFRYKDTGRPKHESLAIRQNGLFTPAFRKLTGMFYLDRAFGEAG